MAVRLHTTLDASEPQRRGNFSHVLASPGGDGGALCRVSGGGRGDRAAGRPAAVRPLQRPRLPVSRAPRTTTRCASWPSCARRGCASATSSRRPSIRERARGAPGGGDADHREAGPARLLPAAPRHARAGPGGRGRGARARQRPGAAAARARPRLERVLDRLLPDRALARRPDRQRAADRALPQRGADVAARHRPRLPARHPRGADPARARALRPRPLGAGGRLPHLPRPRGDPGAGQGAGAAAGGDRAGGARQRGMGRARGRQGHREHADSAAAARLAAGPGWRGWRPRPTGCRAICPSTRAG